MKQTLPLNHYSTGTLNNIGLVYKIQGKYEEELKYLNESLEMRKQALPSNDTSIVDSIFKIGLVYKDQGKYEEAMSYLNQCLVIMGQTIIPPDDSSIEDTIYNIRIVYRLVYKKQGQTTDEMSKAENLKKLREYYLKYFFLLYNYSLKFQRHLIV